MQKDTHDHDYNYAHILENHIWSNQGENVWWYDLQKWKICEDEVTQIMFVDWFLQKFLSNKKTTKMTG